MTVHHLLPTNDSRQPGTGMFDTLRQWRDRATIERAKGALMRRADP